MAQRRDHQLLWCDDPEEVGYSERGKGECWSEGQASAERALFQLVLLEQVEVRGLREG